ncbi:hypothetical protein WBG06_10615 [Nocardioides sp. CCNWLW239]|uniref:hypothetical protein n=1 Tax=Nocardioides sp. CCNWLW239 TaxID=3128902 RepID=UPI003018723D
MTWTQTHERYRLLNQAEAELRTGIAPRLPWSAEYVEAFGTPERLAQALRHRWRIRFQAQLDPALSQEDYEATFAELLADLAPLLDRIGTDELHEELADVSA